MDNSVVNNAAINMGMQVLILYPDFNYFEKTQIWDYESYDSSIFNLFRSLHAVLHGQCVILHSPQQCTRILLSPILSRLYFS